MIDDGHTECVPDLVQLPGVGQAKAPCLAPFGPGFHRCGFAVQDVFDVLDFYVVSQAANGTTGSWQGIQQVKIGGVLVQIDLPTVGDYQIAYLPRIAKISW